MSAEINVLELTRRANLPFDQAMDEAARPSAAAGATMVNRTHRIVRERAKVVNARRTLMRSLSLPLAVCAGLMILLFSAMWAMLDQYDLTPSGIPDASQQMIVLLMWCLPISALLLAIVYFRQAGSRPGRGNPQ